MKKCLLLLLPFLTLGCSDSAPPPKTIASVQVQDTEPKVPELKFLYSVAIFEDLEAPPSFCFDTYSTASGPVIHTEEVIGWTTALTEGDPCYKRFTTQKVYGQCIQEPREIDEGLWVQEYVFFYTPGKGYQSCLRAKGAWIPVP
jgi:hypothetical protein